MYLYGNGYIISILDICFSVEETGSKMQEVKFRKTVFSHGTLRDKLAAHVLRCMEAPVHSLSHLNALISMVTPKARRGYEEALSKYLYV